MTILGIESSCDETAASLLEIKGSKTTPHFRVLSNVVSSQIKIHARYGGVVPEVAARQHAEVIIPVIKEALRCARILIKKTGALQTTHYKLQIPDIVAVTYGPGLITSLRVGVDTAKTLAYLLKKPLVPVNHIEGHIYSSWLRPVGEFPIFQPAADHPQGDNFSAKGGSASGGQFPILVKFPALVLVVSGGHTELVLMKNHGQYKIIGETRDDAVGEAFDKVAKILGLGYPGGPAVSAIADRFQISDFRFQISLPRPMLNSPDYDFSFAGLKTAVLYLVRDFQKNPNQVILLRSQQYNLKQKQLFLLEKLKPLIAYEFQNACVEVLIAKTVRAAQALGVKTVLLAGGVAANKKLRADLETAIKQLPGVNCVQPNLEYTGDNAAMIAAAGYFNYAKNPKRYKDGWRKIKVNPNLTL